eukprot:sb/3479275/
MSSAAAVVLLALVSLQVSAAVECYHSCSITTKWDVDGVDEMYTVANETSCPASTLKTCATGEVCTIVELTITTKMTWLNEEGSNMTADVEASSM